MTNTLFCIGRCACVVAHNTMVVDERDPLAYGF
jgi:proline racemase